MGLIYRLERYKEKALAECTDPNFAAAVQEAIRILGKIDSYGDNLIDKEKFSYELVKIGTSPYSTRKISIALTEATVVPWEAKT